VCTQPYHIDVQWCTAGTRYFDPDDVSNFPVFTQLDLDRDRCISNAEFDANPEAFGAAAVLSADSVGGEGGEETDPAAVEVEEEPQQRRDMRRLLQEGVESGGEADGIFLFVSDAQLAA